MTENKRETTKRKKRTAWVKPWLQRRTQYGAFESLVQELRREDEDDYNNYFWMKANEFDEILNLVLVHPGIMKIIPINLKS